MRRAAPDLAVVSEVIGNLLFSQGEHQVHELGQANGLPVGQQAQIQSNGTRLNSNDDDGKASTKAFAASILRSEPCMRSAMRGEVSSTIV